MDTLKLRSFLFWCLILNIVMFGSWVSTILLAPDFVYRTQSAFLPISEATFHTSIYCIFGAYKLLFVFFNLIPYIALRLTTRGK